MHPKNVHTLLGKTEMDSLAWRLAQLHGYRDDQNAILFKTKEYGGSIFAHVNHQHLYLNEIFDWEIKESFTKQVTHLPGYPFHLAIGFPPYQAYFPTDYPHHNQLPLEVTFIYHVLQLLAIDGLLIIFAETVYDHWPTEELNKVALQVDEYLLSPTFGQPMQHALKVYQRKPTDAVRYE